MYWVSFSLLKLKGISSFYFIHNFSAINFWLSVLIKRIYIGGNKDCSFLLYIPIQLHSKRKFCKDFCIPPLKNGEF